LSHFRLVKVVSASLSTILFGYIIIDHKLRTISTPKRDLRYNFFPFAVSFQKQFNINTSKFKFKKIQFNLKTTKELLTQEI